MGIERYQSSHISTPGTRRVAVFLRLLIATIWSQCPVWSQTPLRERVLVIYNSSASESLAVAKYYMALQKIPQNNLCRIGINSDDPIHQEEFESRVRMPVRKCLEAIGRQK